MNQMRLRERDERRREEGENERDVLLFSAV